MSGPHIASSRNILFIFLLLHPQMRNVMPPLRRLGANANKSTSAAGLNGGKPVLSVTARNAERGAWAFRNGIPCPLGDPVLIHYEDLYDRPEPHYIDAR